MNGSSLPPRRAIIGHPQSQELWDSSPWAIMDNSELITGTPLSLGVTFPHHRRVSKGFLIICNCKQFCNELLCANYFPAVGAVPSGWVERKVCVWFCLEGLSYFAFPPDKRTCFLITSPTHVYIYVFCCPHIFVLSILLYVLKVS